MQRTVEIPSDSLVFRRTESVSDKLKLYRYLIQIHCMMQGIYLPHSEGSLLSYYATYGVSPETEELFKKETPFSRQVLANMRYKLSKIGLLKKNVKFKRWELPDFLTYNLKSNLTFILNFEYNDGSAVIPESE